MNKKGTLLGGVAVALAVVAGFAMWQRGRTPTSVGPRYGSAVSSEGAASSGPRMAKAPRPHQSSVEATANTVRIVITCRRFLLNDGPRSRVDRTAYYYAAEHPEVLANLRLRVRGFGAQVQSRLLCPSSRREWGHGRRDEHAPTASSAYVATVPELQRSAAVLEIARRSCGNGPDFLTMTSTPLPPAHQHRVVANHTLSSSRLISDAGLGDGPRPHDFTVTALSGKLPRRISTVETASFPAAVYRAEVPTKASGVQMRLIQLLAAGCDTMN
jgi:hypothetical protein